MNFERTLRCAVLALGLTLPVPPCSFGAEAVSDPIPPHGSGQRTREAVLNHRYPRLIVVISIDQLRYDYLTRFSDLFLPAFDAEGNVGGFRLLMERGAVMANAHYSHLPMFTGPGHATILTGATPSDSGIIGNDWLTSTGQSINCVGDPTVEIVGSGRPQPAGRRRGSYSPRNLQAETVGDALRLSNNLQSKVVGIAIKDRGAILLTGKNPTAVVWFDSASGNWVTSTYYTTGTLPSFAERANRERLADAWVGFEWNYLLPPDAYRRSAPAGVEGAADGGGLGAGFPKKLSDPGATPDAAYWRKMTISPFGNEFVLATARLAIEEEGLGEDDVPDILALSFSTNDLVGHTWGPNSPEAQDVTLRTDRALASFFNDLRTSRPSGLGDVLIVLTADHGVAPLPNWAASAMRYEAGREMYDTFITAANEALAARFPDRNTEGLVAGFSEPYIVFNRPRMLERGIEVRAAREAVAEKLRTIGSVKAVYTRDQVATGQLHPSRISEKIANGFHHQRSGDVFVLSNPFYYPSRSKTGATHGSAYNYDTQVPILIAGPTIRPGFYTEQVDVRDIAPTLSAILGIAQPASSSGRVLTEILD